MIKKSVCLILFLIVIAHLIYSFRQHANIGLDGDMAEHILPSPWFEKVFNDPFGISVLIKNEIYPSPNRFFGHWFYSKYFKTVPGFLQNFISPVDSVYVASAIAKIIVQFLIMMILAFYISGRKNIFSLEFLLALVMISPFFITYQYYRFGIIDQAVTFVFFYALPLGLLLIFLFPFFNFFFRGKEINTGMRYRIYRICFAVILCLSGPLIPGIILSVCPAVLFYLFVCNFKHLTSDSGIKRIFKSIKIIQPDVRFYFILLSVLSLYSLYIGRNNLESINMQIPLSERYSILPYGIVNLFSEMDLLPPLIIFVFLNLIIIKIWYDDGEGKKILTFSKWTAVCSFIYIIFLPMGGYRAYRPFLLRYDTVMPVTLSLILIFGLSVFYLFPLLKQKYRIMFSAVVIVFLFFYFYEDKSTAGENECQRNALYKLSESKEKVAVLDTNCTIMSWTIIKDPEDSEFNADLFKYWGITKEKKLFYQK